MSRGVWAGCAVGVAVLGVVAAGCAGPGASPSSSGATSVAVSTSLSQDELYDLAVAQYRALYETLTQMDQSGGAPQLPAVASSLVMDPARGAIERAYAFLYASGDRYVKAPTYELIGPVIHEIDDPPDGTVIAVKACELTKGAPMVALDGSTIQDGSPVMMYRRAYFKWDLADHVLKVFIFNGEQVDVCPFK